MRIPSASIVLTSRICRIAAARWVEHAVDPSLVRLVPTLDPVAEIERAVGTEVGVGRQHRPDELLGIDQLERRPLGLEREAADPALAARARGNRPGRSASCTPRAAG